MGLVVTTPYKTNTVASVSGTTFNSNGTPFAAGDVGRCIRFGAGNASGQSRKIITYNSTSQVTLDYAWNVSPCAGITESLPTAGDTWMMSKTLTEYADAVNLIARNAYQFEFVGTGHSFSTCFVYDTKKHIYWTSDNITLASTAAFRFGDIASDGTTSGGCSITDSAATTNGLAVGSASGDYEQYGGSYLSQASNVNLRLYRSSTQLARFVDVQTYGPFGLRCQGTKSVQQRMSIRSNTSTAITCASPMGLIDAVDVKASNYLYFWNIPLSLSITVSGLQFAGLTQALFNVSSTGVSASYTMTVNGIDMVAAAAQPQYLNCSAYGAGYNQFIVTNNSLAFNVKTPVGGAIASPRVVVQRSDTTVVLDTTPASGLVPATWLEVIKHTITATGNQSVAAGADRRPFSVLIRHYNYFEYIAVWDGNLNAVVNVAMVADATVVQATVATVAAYTTLATLDKLRDYWKYQTTQDMTFADAGVGAGRIDSVSRSLTVDATAGSVWAYAGSTATIKASGMAAGSTYLTAKTVNLTLSNGATWSVPVEVTGVATVGALANLVGAISLTGSGRLDFIAGSGVTANTGTAASGTTVRCTSASAAAVCDFSAFSFVAGSTFENTSGQAVTLKLSSGQTVPTLLATSGAITLDNAVTATFTLTNLIVGSRYRIEKTDGTLLTNGTAASSSVVYSYSWTVDIAVNIIVRKSSAATKYLPFNTTATLTSINQSLTVNQIVDPIA